MSLEALKWAVHDADTQDPAEMAVLCALADRAWGDGSNAFPSIDTIAWDSRMSRSTAQRALARLEERGIIRRGDQSITAAWQYPTVVWDLCMDTGPRRPAKPAKVKKHPKQVTKADFDEYDRQAGQVDLPARETPATQAGRSDTPQGGQIDPSQAGHPEPPGRSLVTYNSVTNPIPPSPQSGTSGCPRHERPVAGCRGCGTSLRDAERDQLRAAAERRRAESDAAIQADRRLKAETAHVDHASNASKARELLAAAQSQGATS